ncbi:hypothetical protein DAPK24_054850 [Pichia kluyveri]|uniref:Uncharacterized protein n=1 Tax=Pichia kluyveri TaxID=36015 RepID=A0AAV5RCH0_PICKL|nr:hypothetical protein DAPK24_054850 [Pichia kluyveri]
MGNCSSTDTVKRPTKEAKQAKPNTPTIRVTKPPTVQNSSFNKKNKAFPKETHQLATNDPSTTTTNINSLTPTQLAAQAAEARSKNKR